MTDTHAQFQERLVRSHEASLAVAEFFRARDWMTEVPEIRVSPSFSERYGYGDGGKDVIIWKESDGVRRNVEVKLRSIDFTCSDDFPYQTINLDRVNKCDENGNRLEPRWIYASANRTITHVAIVHINSQKHWLVENTIDSDRDIPEYPIYRCPKEHAYFFPLRNGRPD